MHHYFTSRLRLRRLIGPLCAFGLFVYFLFHLVHGDRGFVSGQGVEAQIRLAKAQLTVLQKERETLEHRVRLLRPDSLDPDMLEERARVVLGYTRPDEMIVISH